MESAMSTAQRPLPSRLAELATALGLRSEVVIYDAECLGAIFPTCANRPPRVAAAGGDADAIFEAVCRKLEQHARATATAKRQRADTARRIADDVEREASAIEVALRAFEGTGR
jgi:hypothetical protein